MMKDKKVDVCVLMSTYNGEKYLRAQIDSILAQEGVNVKILVRDDGSKDETLKILEEYKAKGLLEYYQGENLGPAYSFLQLLHDAPECTYYAFSDQDDVWLKEKLYRGVMCLKEYDSIPAFYDSKATIVDADLHPTGGKYGSSKVYNFATQMARSNVIGCTMVLNHILKERINEYNPKSMTMHDQWIAIVCKSFIGVEVKDNESYIFYRQHGNNTVGAKNDIRSKMESSSLHQGNRRLKQAKELYSGYYDIMPSENKDILNKIVKYKRSLANRVKAASLNYNTENIFYNALIRTSFFRGAF